MKRVLVTGGYNIGKAGVATIVYRWGQNFDNNCIVYDYLMARGFPDREYVENIRQKAYFISGNKNKINNIFELKDQRPLKHFGDNYTYWYYGDLNKTIKNKMDDFNISYENISLNELFLSMNRKDVTLYE